MCAQANGCMTDAGITCYKPHTPCTREAKRCIQSGTGRDLIVEELPSADCSQRKFIKFDVLSFKTCTVQMMQNVIRGFSVKFCGFLSFLNTLLG